MDLGLKNKVCLVAGGSRGLGRAVAQGLCEEGAHVVVFSRDAGRLAQTVKELGASAYGIPGDISREGDIERIVTETKRRFGAIHVLVNNSGGPPPGEFEDVSDEQWHIAFEMLVMGPVRLTRHVLPSMRDQKWGRILNLVSSSVEQPIPGLMLSNSLRCAVVGWSKTLGNEVAADGISVNCLAPGRIDTDRVRELDTIKAQKLDMAVEDVQKQSKSTIPMGRYGDPAEFGRVATFLCSEAAGYMTGSVVRADGGAIKCL